MELEDIKRVYLVGIGGIGMSGLARYFHHRSCLVAGYDRTPTPLTDALLTEGMEISFRDTTDSIPGEFLENEGSTLIIYTPAVPRDSLILNYFLENNFTVKKRSAVLGLISRNMYTIAVGGTHGKTTTSTLVAHILRESGWNCTAFLGGISANYHTNVLLGNTDFLVVEADEFDRSFLTLHPDIAIITAMDADHLDIYGDVESVRESFQLFASQIKENGHLIHKKGLDLAGGSTYSATDIADAYAENVRIEKGAFHFDFRSGTIRISNISMAVPGLHNVENAVAAIKACVTLSLPSQKIKAAVESFRGVKRRFEYIIKNDRFLFIDDYAHHPEELRACLTAAKRLYPEKKLTVIFQPHLYSRTRDFANGFGEVLSMADELFLLDIYPAREEPIPGITSSVILEKVHSTIKKLCSKEEVLELVRERKPELLITVGAGDIDMLVEPIKNVLLHV